MKDRTVYYIIAVGLAIALLVLVLTGCSGDLRKDTGIGLLAVKDTLIETATTAKRMCEQGIIIDEDDCESIEKAYTEARDVLIEAERIWQNMVMMEQYPEQH